MSFDKTELLQRWAALSPRERLLLSLGTLSIGLALAYLLLYAPMQVENQRLQQQIQAQQQIQQHLQAVAQRVNALHQQGISQPVESNDAAQVIAESSRQMGLAAGIHSQPEAEGRFAIKVRQLGFDKLVYWLAVLQQQHGLRVTELKLRRVSAASDSVEGELTLQSN